MNKSGKILLCTLGGVLALSGAGTLIYYKVPAVKNFFTQNKVTAEDPIKVEVVTPDDQYTKEEYIDLINTYANEVIKLQAELNTYKETTQATISENQAKINELEEELSQLTEEQSELIAEKTEHINVLKQTIAVLQAEEEDIVSDYESKISNLNALLSNYEAEIIKTISLPDDFVFTSLGFQVVNDSDFCFWSTSHSCKLYYYHFDTSTLETIPINGSSFSNFNVSDNSLYFTTSSVLYRYDFNTKELSLLISDINKFELVSDDNCDYFFSTSGGYGVFDKNTNKFTNYGMSSSNSSYLYVAQQDNFIIHTAYGSTDVYNSAHYYFKVFDTLTGEDHVLLDSRTSTYILNSFVKTSHGYYVFLGPNFYRFNSLNYSVELIKELPNNNLFYNSAYAVEDYVIFRNGANVYLYDGETVTDLYTFTGGTITTCNLTFFNLSDNIYYFVTSNSNAEGVYKLDLTNLSCEQIFQSGEGFKYSFDFGHYKVLWFSSNCLLLDMDIGSISVIDHTSSTSSQAYNISHEILTVGNFDFIIVSGFTSSSDRDYNEFLLPVYDREKDMFIDLYGTLTSTSFIKGIKVQNDSVFIMTGNYLYEFQPNVTLDNYISRLSIESSMSNLQVGVFYSEIGLIDNNKLYVKYILNPDNSFTKELVII